MTVAMNKRKNGNKVIYWERPKTPHFRGDFEAVKAAEWALAYNQNPPGLSGEDLAFWQKLYVNGRRFLINQALGNKTR